MRSLGPSPTIVSRREQRFFPTAAELVAFLEHTIDVDLWATPWNRDKPIQYLRTTYLDSEDLALLNSTVRRRLRLREYARASEPNEAPAVDRTCYLELKQINGSLHRKMRFQLDRDALLRDDGSVDVNRALDAARGTLSPVFATMGVPLQSLRPCVTTCFRRVSLGSSRPRLRVTLDHTIAFSLPASLADNIREPDHVVGYGPQQILEVKHEDALPEWLTDALCLMPAPLQISKFELGLKTVLSGPRSGRRYKAPIEPISWPRVKIEPKR